ncbi:hypothetical protein DFP72DRAFT_844820 [Ephemerocybe angulata]|uniref:Nucleoplasmin-like domain-containing protein n=1 Tax=Ephemerocybe angulata TaxID=980116 RepID=A0A8H6I529_9AGAR|nr:hypothetical protein DFP72DRAFT_844820 [Tulosesus angulatus]
MSISPMKGVRVKPTQELFIQGACLGAKVGTVPGRVCLEFAEGQGQPYFIASLRKNQCEQVNLGLRLEAGTEYRLFARGDFPIDLIGHYIFSQTALPLTSSWAVGSTEPQVEMGGLSEKRKFLNAEDGKRQRQRTSTSTNAAEIEDEGAFFGPPTSRRLGKEKEGFNAGGSIQLIAVALCMIFFDVGIMDHMKGRRRLEKLGLQHFERQDQRSSELKDSIASIRRDSEVNVDATVFDGRELNRAQGEEGVGFAIPKGGVEEAMGYCRIKHNLFGASIILGVGGAPREGIAVVQEEILG